MCPESPARVTLTYPDCPRTDPGAETAVVLRPLEVVDELHHLLLGLLQTGHVAELHPAAFTGQRVHDRELGAGQRALRKKMARVTKLCEGNGAGSIDLRTWCCSRCQYFQRYTYTDSPSTDE